MDRKELVLSVYDELGARGRYGISPGALFQHGLSLGYDPIDLAAAPADSYLGLGCGNPVGGENIQAGSTVVDIGCGGGFDCIAAARKVGDTGCVIGVDESAEMIARARRSVEATGLTNVAFIQCDIEDLPIPSSSVDVVLSNCVLNLVTDKQQVFNEIARILKRTGRFAFSDIMLRRPLPESLRRRPSFFVGCIAGAITKAQYFKLLDNAGFVSIEVIAERELVAEPDNSVSFNQRSHQEFESVRGSIVSLDVCATLSAEEMTSRHARPSLLAIAPSREMLAAASAAGLDVVMIGSKGPGGGAWPFYPTDFEDASSVHALLTDLRRSRPIVGVVASEAYHVPDAARCAEFLKLTHTISACAAMNGEDKLRARRCLQLAGVRAPRFAGVNSIQAAVRAAIDLSWPVIVKPCNDSNSRLVRLCRRREDLETAATSIQCAEFNLAGQRLSSEILVEEYIDGPEFSVELFIYEGAITIMAVCEKTLGPTPYFVEVGYAVPATISASLRKELCLVAESALRALTADNVVAHIELRIRDNQAYVIEVNLRVAGGKVPCLVHTATGWDMNAVAVDIAIGKVPTRSNECAAMVGVYHCLTADVPSIITYDRADIELLCDFPEPILELSVAPGTHVFPVNDSRGRIFGRILAWGSDSTAAWDTIRKIRAAMCLEIKPVSNSPSGAPSQPGAWTSGCC